MFTKLAAAAALASTASAQVYQGFNYGASFTDGTAKQLNDFQQEFQTAQNLVGHPGFTSARLYTNIQAGTQNTPSSAFQAAINTKTSLLLGIWGSSGQGTVDTEIAALNAALQQYGSALTNLIAGISVGSEDLYRNSPTGIAYHSDVGANPADIIGYINCVKGNMTSRGVTAPVGHVDTWTAWVNGSNGGVISASDFLGVDMYPYFQTNDSNGIDNGANLFYQALAATQGVSGGKPVWVTETGWPVSGAQSGAAVCNVQNAQTYWKQVACPILGQISTWWYTLQDVEPGTPDPSFGIISGPALTTTPLFDLSCNASSTSLPSNVTGSGKPGSGSGTGSGSSTSGSGAPGSTGGSYPGSSNSGAPGAPGASGAPGSTSGGAPGTPGSSSGSAPGSSSGSAPGAYGSTSGTGQGASANGNTGSGSSGAAGSSPYGSTGSAPYGSNSSAPYGSSPYGSAPTPGAGSGPGAYPGSSTSTGKPAAYTGAAVANSPQVAMVAGLMGLAALLA